VRRNIGPVRYNGDMASYYDVLDVSAFADAEEVKRAYYRKAQLLHPDRFAAAPAEERQRAEAEMKTVNEAWNTLRNPEARRRYDVELGLARGDEQADELGDGVLWDETEDGDETPLRPSLLRRQGVKLAVVFVLVAGLVVSAVAFLAPGGSNRGGWSAGAIDDLRSAAINAGMTTPQADCFVEEITSRYSPSDEVDQAVIQQLAEDCR
jgi:curved DNA-binding protein CbpA